MVCFYFLGCYFIYFYFSGNVFGFYVCGCLIYYIFNWVMIIYGVIGLFVEYNVVYYVMGYVFFIEDGIEIGNMI